MIVKLLPDLSFRPPSTRGANFHIGKFNKLYLVFYVIFAFCHPQCTYIVSVRRLCSSIFCTQIKHIFQHVDRKLITNPPIS